MTGVAGHDQIVALVIRALNAGTATGLTVRAVDSNGARVTAHMLGGLAPRDVAFRYLRAADPDGADPVLSQSIPADLRGGPFEVWTTPDGRVYTYVEVEPQDAPSQESTR